MSSSAAPNPATPQQVMCETSDKQQIAVELEVLRLSHTFDDMYKNLGLDVEGGEFPGTFPVPNIEARVFKKVVDWCKAHKGQPDPVVEKDPFTQESQRLEFTDYARTFFDLPASELLELVMAAKYLDIRGLYHYGCQAIADLIKGMETLEARLILQQQCDLMRREISYTRSHCPWLDPKADVLGEPGDVPNPIHIPSEVLITIFEKLTRADLERLQLVSQQFRNIIMQNEELPLRPLEEVHFTTLADHWHYTEDARTCGPMRILVLSVGDAKCLKGCAVRKLMFRDTISSEHCALLRCAMSDWKHVVVCVQPERFSSPAVLTCALTHLLFCKELRVSGDPAESAHSFMHLPAIVSCNRLDMMEIYRGGFEKRGRNYRFPPLEPADIIEWLEHEPEKNGTSRVTWLSSWLQSVAISWEWWTPSRSRKPYVLRIRTYHSVAVDELLSNAVGEQLRIRFERFEEATRLGRGIVVVRFGDVVVVRE
ncbi:S-phase kinase-associated protein 1-like [Aphelenchoides avenae]|nr:S-phase kinase-associated protein 1-like [Aphelenchus avenae]